MYDWIKVFCLKIVFQKNSIPISLKALKEEKITLVKLQFPDSIFKFLLPLKFQASFQKVIIIYSNKKWTWK